MSEPDPRQQIEPTDHPGDHARGVLIGLVESLASALRKIAKSDRRHPSKAVHAARVLTRRLGAAAAAFGPHLDDSDLAEALARRAARVRKALGPLRDADVHAALLRARGRAVSAACRAGVEHAGKRLEKLAARARPKAVRAASKHARALGARSWRKRLERSAWTGPGDGAAVARLALEPAMGAVRAAAAADLRQVAAVHALRIALKRLRYVIDAVLPWLDAGAATRAETVLRRLQRRLGAVNDADGLLARYVEAAGHARRKRTAAVARSAQALVLHQRAELRAAAAEFRAAWRRAGAQRLLERVESLWKAGPAATPRAGGAESGRQVRAATGAGSGAGPVAAPGGGPVRLAAIDIGTNTTRLIIAEASPDGTYRVLDDEKEVTRLGAGLDATGRIDAKALEQAAYTVARMKRIADGYGAARVRAVATCAVREASNGARLVELVERWAGLKVEVIGGEEEAWLAFRSVAHAFDLSMFSSAVVDVGGGSTEIVLSSAGAVERIVSLPVGAVRLTERFGGAVAASGPRFKALRRHVRGLLAERLGGEAFTPQLVIGTGGTVTSLAAVAMHRERRRTPHAPPPSAVQGFEMKRSDVRDVLDELRGLDAERRARVPGLSPDRVDIIVPGAAILMEIMEHLGAPRLRAHDGGIRDGLLLTMVQEIFPGERPAPRAGDPVAAARRFAAACRTDERHGVQVARLALSIFDQLAAVEHDRGGDGAWARPQHRVALEAACHLLDVGYVINYTKHHVHSYNLIRHSELPGLTPAQVELVAQIARYHRAAEPRNGHEHFAALDEEEREVVRRLAAVVRLAVGLDRTHTQAITAVRVTVRGGAARFVLEARENPSVDIWGAERKAGMFRSVFGLEPQFVWAAPAPAGVLNGVHGRGGPAGGGNGRAGGRRRGAGGSEVAHGPAGPPILQR